MSVMHVCTVWGGRLSKRFCNMFSGSSPCLLAWAAWQLQFSPTACGTPRKDVTKPFPQVYLIGSTEFQYLRNCWNISESLCRPSHSSHADDSALLPRNSGHIVDRTGWQFNRNFWPPKSWPKSSPNASVTLENDLGHDLGGQKTYWIAYL